VRANSQFKSNLLGTGCVHPLEVVEERVAAESRPDWPTRRDAVAIRVAWSFDLVVQAIWPECIMVALHGRTVNDVPITAISF